MTKKTHINNKSFLQFVKEKKTLLQENVFKDMIFFFQGSI